jgi:hypothetical protein
VKKECQKQFDVLKSTERYYCEGATRKGRSNDNGGAFEIVFAQLIEKDIFLIKSGDWIMTGKLSSWRGGPFVRGVGKPGGEVVRKSNILCSTTQDKHILSQRRDF